MSDAKESFDAFCESYAKKIGHTPNPDGAAYKFAKAAWEAATKAAATSRVVGPNAEQIDKARIEKYNTSQEQWAFIAGAEWYRDNLRIEPFDIKKIFPPKNELREAMKIVARDCLWSGSEEEFLDTCEDAYDFIREYVKGKMK